jgi:hypothetical protein
MRGGCAHPRSSSVTCLPDKWSPAIANADALGVADRVRLHVVDVRTTGPA